MSCFPQLTLERSGILVQEHKKVITGQIPKQDNLANLLYTVNELYNLSATGTDARFAFVPGERLICPFILLKSGQKYKCHLTPQT